MRGSWMLWCNSDNAIYLHQIQLPSGIVSADTDNNIGVAGTAGGTENSAGVSLMHLVTFGNTGVGGFARVLSHMCSSSVSYSFARHLIRAV
eukprot:6212952-Pleurochrysis_carterae.AAC.1